MLNRKHSRHTSTLAKGRLKRIIQHQPTGPQPVVVSSQRPFFRSPPTWIRLVGSFFSVIIIGGGLAVYLLFTNQSSTQKSEATAFSQATIHYHTATATSSQYQIPTPTPSSQKQVPTPTSASQQQVPTPTSASQQQVPTPTPSSQQQVPNPTSPVISPAIPAGKPLYSTAHPYAACDKEGGHWTDASGARVACKANGSEIVNTAGQLATANLDQLGGEQSPWPGQDFVVQVQVTMKPDAQGAFGINFQPEASKYVQGHFAYLLNPDGDWAFNYYNAEGKLTHTLVAARLFSPISRQLTIDIRVEGTRYKFYVNGVDTTGHAITGPLYINKIVGLTVDEDADVTFSDFAVFALE